MEAQTKEKHGEAYAKSLKAMTDQELQKECETAIWFSAYAANNPRCEYHWKVDLCYDESKERDTENVTIYKTAYENIAESLGCS